jgi:glycosyltransferase involved in cell wall biosynthesis
MLRSLTYFHYLYGDDTALNHVRQFAAAAGALGCKVNTHALNLGNQHFASGQTGAKSQVRAALKKRFSRLLHEPKELAWNARYLGIELRTLRRERPPALLVRDNLYSASYVLAAKMAGLPLVIEVNSPAAESRAYRHDYAHLPLVPEYLERTKLRHADAVMAVSSPLRAHLIEQSGIDPSRVHVVLNGADAEKFSPSVQPDPEVAALVNSSPVVGFVGSFAEWHNPELLGRMAVHVSKRCPQARFVFVGDGDGLPRVKDITAEISDRMVFTGRVPHSRVPGLVRLFDVGVLADTAFYCCPLKILEWMAAGVPVVAPDYASVRDIIDDGVNGTLFPPKDYDAMAASIADLLATPERCEALGNAASAKIRGELTWKHNAGRVLAICEEAASAYAARRGAAAA